MSKNIGVDIDFDNSNEEPEEEAEEERHDHHRTEARGMGRDFLVEEEYMEGVNGTYDHSGEEMEDEEEEETEEERQARLAKAQELARRVVDEGEQIEGITGTLNHNGEFREWSEMSSGVNSEGDIIPILPYVDYPWSERTREKTDSEWETEVFGCSASAATDPIQASQSFYSPCFSY